MTIKVLVVDDSSFFRRRVSEILSQDPQLEVVAVAKHGAEAVKMVPEFRPQVITMDIEMPVMDGITAVKNIMAENPTPILMFSSLTQDGAKATLDALDAGALDFLPKKFEDIATNRDDAIRLLQQKVKELGRRRLFRRVPMTKSTPSVGTPKSTITPSRVTNNSNLNSFGKHSQITQEAPQAKINHKASGKRYKALVIGTSTGGPVALQRILTQFPKHYPHPILLIQHMPSAFTPAFASRLNGLCQIEVKEAQNGDALQPGCAYLAPGGMQMLVDKGGAFGRVKVISGSVEMNYKPSVDITFASVSKTFGADALAVVLTGMGADGREGARLLKTAGSTIWSQDEASCVVYGMPQAVTVAGLSSKSISLDNMAEAILKESGQE
ncbi:chemotaxis response regulator protein-glutamate methylesterase [Parashewanella spongiae]|uniref:Protein-glutamate methylesterase/protein-glutamine glutaminase n=1 Tax=Parashewanella spongiae TaxID=342950 RepID=A0A3A6U9Q5_9GAMM|nr:chemotaxis response regulator protein-glutamate methylesterase [Parashewanella spongiae]MCL1077664.1 chemotaxis response regulator protein-glutamate methylesterase [Parashewanella spongiae]RJY18250.1 chemotaxis response regulator protein-glutamate methylesterase [Parashewanella spongiae]